MNITNIRSNRISTASKILGKSTQKVVDVSKSFWIREFLQETCL